MSKWNEKVELSYSRSGEWVGRPKGTYFMVTDIFYVGSVVVKRARVKAGQVYVKIMG